MEHGVMRESPVIVVGPGRLGLTILRSLADSDRPLFMVGRSSGPWQEYALGRGAEVALKWDELSQRAWSGADVFLAVPDRQLRALMGELADFISAQTGPGPELVLHGSGAHGLEVFSEAIESSFACLHPLAALGGLAQETTLRDLPVTVLASCVEARQRTRHLAESMRAKVIEVQPGSDRRRYHLACSLAANHVTGLVGWATDLLAESMSEVEARQCALALGRSALNGIEEVGPRAALTGPVARRDESTLRAHLDALDPTEASRYQALLDELKHFAFPHGEGSES